MADDSGWHKCKFCDRRFTKVEHLNRHQRSHTGEKPFKCPKCNQRYARSDVLARHIQNHPKRVYRSKATQQVPSPKARQQLSSISVDNSQQDDELRQARTVTPPMACNDTGRDAGAPGHALSSDHPAIHATYQHTSTAGAGQQPVQQRVSPPIQLASDISQHLFVPEPMQDQIMFHPAVTDDYQPDNPSLFISHAPLLEPPIVEAWPFSTITLYPDYDLSSINMDVALHSAHPSPRSTRQLLEGEPSPFEVESSLVEVPMTKSNQLEETGSPSERRGPDSLKRIQQMWSGKGTSQPALLVRTLWKDIAEHKAVNILSDPAEPSNLPSTPSSERRGGSEMESKITEQCRDRLFAFYRQTQTTPGRRSLSNVLSASEAQLGERSSAPLTDPGLSDIQFPSVEILNLSLKFYFRHVHPSLPFIHRPTFNVSETSCLLLLPMILIGYSILDPHGSQALVSRCRPRLIEVCRLDLACKARGRSSPPSGLVRSLASSVLILYLNLEDRNCEEDAALMLCAQALHIAEKHGLYETHKSQNLISSLLTKYSNQEGAWKLWARVESVKRLILCLIRIDAAYARLLGTAGVVDPNQVNIVLPVNSLLFDSPRADQFGQEVKIPAADMPVMHMRDFAEWAPPSEMMNGFLLQVILDYIQVLIFDSQVKIFSVADDRMLQTSSFAPVNLYNRSAEASHIGHHLVAISSNYSRLLQRPDPLPLLSWNYLCMLITAPVEQLELALGRRGPESAPKARAAIEVWCNSPAARRAVLHAAQIFYILTNHAYSPLSLVDNTLLRVECMVLTSALVLGMYFFTKESIMSSSTIAGDSNPPPQHALELLQEIDWTIPSGEGFTDHASDSAIAPDHPERYVAGQCSGVQAREFIRHGVLLISFEGDPQRQGAKTAQTVFQEYAYLLDQLGGHRGSGSDFATLARSVSDLLEC
ncbi:hypothetical protein ZTR_04929 [Talaromyces verruculosus]|nr:hypothetical protein ZTR_04929 [Talaromyces verruculosus]